MIHQKQNTDIVCPRHPSSSLGYLHRGVTIVSIPRIYDQENYTFAAVCKRPECWTQ